MYNEFSRIFNPRKFIVRQFLLKDDLLYFFKIHCYPILTTRNKAWLGIMEGNGRVALRNPRWYWIGIEISKGTSTVQYVGKRNASKDHFK